MSLFCAAIRFPLEPDLTNHVIVQEGGKLPAGTYTCDLWCDLLHLEGANALATYADDFYAGRPAITENRFGKGRAIYVATRPEPALVSALVGTLLGDLSITAPLEAPEGVEVTRREGDGRAYTFILNHNLFPVPVSLPTSMRNLLTGEMHENSVLLPAREVAILIAEPSLSPGGKTYQPF